MGTEGMDLNQLGNKSLLRLVEELFVYPRAADDNYMVTTVDPDTLDAGDNFTLATLGAAGAIDYPRRITMTLTDGSYDAGAPLELTARVTGHRNGRAVTEDVVGACTDGNATEFVTDKLFEQVTEIKILHKQTASGDDVIFGIAGTALALKYGIKSVTDVVSIIENASGTPQTPLAISSTYVDADQSCIQGISLAVTDIWKVKYWARTDAGIGSAGVYP